MPRYSCDDSEASGWRDIFDLSTDKKISYMIEDLSAWVVIKRFLIVVDNVVAALLFGFFWEWLKNYLGYDSAGCDFSCAINKSIDEIASNPEGEILYFLMYCVLFWRPIRLTRIMPLRYYFAHKLGRLMLAVVAMSAVFIGILYWSYPSEIFYPRSNIVEDYPYVVTVILVSVVILLLFYRRLYLTYYITTKWCPLRTLGLEEKIEETWEERHGNGLLS